MNRAIVLKVAYYFVFACVIGAFYVGLRSEEYKVEYTLIALGLWVVAYFINKARPTEENKAE